MSFRIRPGKSSDASDLSELSVRAKAFWPYDAEFIRDCTEELKVSASRAGDGFIYVGEADGKVIGFYGFATHLDSPEMTHLFVEPKFIGKGFGHKLWIHALSFAKAKGWSSFEIVADPYAAEKFYIPVGCKKIGEIKSSVRPGRKMPLLKFNRV
jgi:GNAT superfamily N-acetyltransferase